MKSNRLARVLLSVLFVSVLMHPGTGLAATRQEYTEASAKWLDIGLRKKTIGVVRRVLVQPLPRPLANLITSLHIL